MSSPDAVLLGLCVIDRLVQVSSLPASEGVALADRVEEHGGGMAANVAVALARLGRRPGLIAALGDDDLGDRMLRELSAEGIELSRVVRRTGRPSTHILLLFDRAFRRCGIFFHPETLFSLAADELDADYIRRARVFFTDLEPPEAALHAAVLAREAGGVVVVDVQAGTTQSEILGIDRHVLRRAIVLCDLFLPSREGLLELTGCSDVPDALDVLCAEFPTVTVAVTLGAAGSLLARGGERIAVPAYPVRVVDTTGAGDIYHAALIEALYFQHWPLDRAGHFASAAAALGCTAVGARTAAPRREAIEQFLVTTRLRDDQPV